MFLLMYAATSRFANRCLRGGGFATIGSPLKFGLRKLHVRFTPKNGLRWSDRPSPKGANTGSIASRGFNSGRSTNFGEPS
jgi:hypothetical protein